MRYLDFVKKYQNFDLHIALMDELGYTDSEITSKLEISKQSIYDARNRLEPLIEALKTVTNPKAITYGDPNINKVLDTFKQAFGVTKLNNYDRYAAKRLIAAHGIDNILSLIKALAESSDDRYCPRVNNVRQIEDKFVSITGYFKSKSAGSKLIEL